MLSASAVGQASSLNSTLRRLISVTLQQLQHAFQIQLSTAKSGVIRNSTWSGTKVMQPPKNGWRKWFPQGLQTDENSRTPPPDADTIVRKGVGGRKAKNKQSLDYVLRTGLAGGLAGCAVWSSCSLDSIALYAHLYPRPKLPSAPSTASKSSSKPPTPNSPNTPVLGSASWPPCATSTAKTASAGSSAGTLQPSCASSPTPPSSSSPTSKSAPLSFPPQPRRLPCGAYSPAPWPESRAYSSHTPSKSSVSG